MQISESQRKSFSAILGLTPYLRELIWRSRGEKKPRTEPEDRKVGEEAREYQRFLVLKVLYPERLIRPLRRTDKIWHAHILDTRRYHQDCQTIFGQYLHHEPGVTDASQDARTAELIRQAFTPTIWAEQDPVLMTLLLPATAPETQRTYDGETCA